MKCIFFSFSYIRGWVPWVSSLSKFCTEGKTGYHENVIMSITLYQHLFDVYSVPSAGFSVRLEVHVHPSNRRLLAASVGLPTPAFPLLPLKDLRALFLPEEAVSPYVHSEETQRKGTHLGEELVHESCVVNSDLDLVGVVILHQLLL